MTIFNVPDMSCGHCKAAIDKAITAADAAAVITYDMAARKIDVTSSLAAADLATLLEQEGYPATQADG